MMGGQMGEKFEQEYNRYGTVLERERTRCAAKVVPAVQEARTRCATKVGPMIHEAKQRSRVMIEQRWTRQTEGTKLRMLATMCLGMFVLTFLVLLHTGTFQMGLDKKGATIQLDEAISMQENCSVSFHVPKQETKPKVFWTTGSPGSVDDSLIKSLGSGLTGQNAPARSYYASSGASKKCISDHPSSFFLVGADVNPETHRNFQGNFQRQVIVLIRNPKTLFPAHNNAKAIKYHNQKGQVPERQWRDTRDTYFQKMLEGWKSSIRQWDTKMKYFKPAMYLAHEDLMDASRGPMALKRLALLLQAWGFHTILESDDDETMGPSMDDDLSCFWYHQMGRERLEQYHQHGYEYSDYVPGYTRQQQDLMLQEIRSMIMDTRNHPELTEILERYYEDIRDNTKLDH